MRRGPVAALSVMACVSTWSKPGGMVSAGPLALLAMMTAWRIMELCLAAIVSAMKPPIDHLRKQNGDRG